MRHVCILGSTGSIGCNTLDVIETYPKEFRIQILTTHKNAALLLEQASKVRPEAVGIFDAVKADEFKSKFAEIGVEVFPGFDGLLELSLRDDFDILVNALVGSVGLHPTLNAIRKGRRIAIANKETLVVGGELVMAKARELGADIIPIDSEHSALLQCLVGEDEKGIRRIILTASGGPFRKVKPELFASLTVEQALDHPNWDMGPKITIDSATLMNKGLEVIEAYWLFQLQPSEIEVVIHPQSIIHSMVEFVDGSIKAQLGLPDMRLPIQYALTFPKRLPAELPRLDFKEVSKLTFEAPDFEKFRCLKLCFDAMESGGAAPGVLNAANEEAVGMFLNEKIPFDRIPAIVEDALTNCQFNGFLTAEKLVEYDKYTREYVLNRHN